MASVVSHDQMQAPRPDRPFRHALGIALRSTLAGAIVAALMDVAISSSRASGAIPGLAMARALEAMIGLYGALGLLLGLAAGVVAGGISATLPAGALRTWRAGLRDEANDHAQAAGILEGCERSSANGGSEAVGPHTDSPSQRRARDPY